MGTRSRGASLAVAMAFVAATGCIYQRGSVVDETTRTLREDRGVVAEEEPDVTVMQRGTALMVRGELRCQPTLSRVVERRTVYARDSAMGPLPWVLGIAGVGAGVIGTLGVTNVFGLPESPRSSSELSREDALFGGVALLVGSAALLGITLAQLIGLTQRDEETTRETLQLGAQGPPGPCAPPRPYAGAEVQIPGASPEQSAVELGALGSDGTLAIDTTRVIPPRYVLDAGTGTVPLTVGGRVAPVGLTLGPLRFMLDGRVWALSESVRCAAAERPDDCRGVEGYLRAFPNGQHASQASAVLGAAHTRLEERARRLEQDRRRAEAERRGEEARWRAEEEARQREMQRQRAADEAAWRAGQQARERDAEERRRAAREQAERRAARSACRRECASTCAGNRQCQSACERQQCQ